MVATKTYGSGFLPIPFIIEITIGIATAAVAVLDVISDKIMVTVRITRMRSLSFVPFPLIRKEIIPQLKKRKQALIRAEVLNTDF